MRRFGAVSTHCALIVRRSKPQYKAERDGAEMLQKLSADIEGLFDAANQGDVTIRVQGEDVRCHEVVLTARSEYLKSVFRSGLQESQTKTTSLDHISAENFK